jgi:hypothetical protein
MATRPSERAGHTGRIWRRAGSVTDAADRTRRVVEGGRDRGYEAAPGKVKRTEQPRPKLPLTRLCSQRLLRTLRWLAQFLSVLTGGASSHFKELGEVLTLIAGPKHVAHFDVEVPFGKGSLWERRPWRHDLFPRGLDVWVLGASICLCSPGGWIVGPTFDLLAYAAPPRNKPTASFRDITQLARHCGNNHTRSA